MDAEWIKYYLDRIGCGYKDGSGELVCGHVIHDHVSNGGAMGGRGCDIRGCPCRGFVLPDGVQLILKER